MRYAPVLVCLLTIAAAGCTSQRAMQQRIDTLEARVAELEARPVGWPLDEVFQSKPAEAERPWWDPAPLPIISYGWHYVSVSWDFPGFEVALIDEAVRYWRNGGRVSEKQYTQQLYDELGKRLFGKTISIDASIPLLVNDYNPSEDWALDDTNALLYYGTFRLPEDR